MSPPRIALYGHDTVGLGHLRRNLALAAAMARLPERPDVLILNGAAEAGAYDLPSGVDLLTVPAVAKDEHGRYRSRRWRGGLDAVVAVRGAAIDAALAAFDPDLLIIDKVPHGFAGELRPTLARLRQRRSRTAPTQVVLGLRDVLDEPVVARAEWRAQRVNDALREHIEEVWVYGDRSIHDLGAACAVPPAQRHRFRYLGYLSSGRVADSSRPPGIDRRTRYALCTVGGGHDGVALARAFAAAAMPAGVTGVLVTGSQMAPDARNALHRRAALRADLMVVEFDPAVERWMPGAAAVVAMGGYNTVAELLSTAIPALIVPRTHPRAEQVVRAAALSAAGHVDRLEPAEPDAARISRWVHGAVTRPRHRREGIELGGLAAASAQAASLLTRGRFHVAAG